MRREEGSAHLEGLELQGCGCFPPPPPHPGPHQELTQPPPISLCGVSSGSKQIPGSQRRAQPWWLRAAGRAHTSPLFYEHWAEVSRPSPIAMGCEGSGWEPNSCLLPWLGAPAAMSEPTGVRFPSHRKCHERDLVRLNVQYIVSILVFFWFSIHYSSYITCINCIDCAFKAVTKLSENKRREKGKKK